MPNYTTLFGTALSDYNLTRGKVPFLDNPDPTDGLYSCGAALMTAASLTGTSYEIGRASCRERVSSPV